MKKKLMKAAVAAANDGKPIHCASILLAAAKGKVWTQIAVTGVYKSHPAGPFELGPQTYSEIIANFDKDGKREIVCDFEHNAERADTIGPVEASGWITDLKVGEDGNLWGLVEWQPATRAMIKSGAYRYGSPAIDFRSKDRNSGKECGARLVSFAVTNRPYLAIAPLAAKDGVATATDDETPAVLLTELGTARAKIVELDAEIKRKNKKYKAIVAEMQAELVTLRAESEARGASERDDYLTEVVRLYSVSPQQVPGLRVLAKDMNAFKNAFPVPPADTRYLTTMIAAGRNGETPAHLTDPSAQEIANVPEVPDLKTLQDKYLAKGMTLEAANSKAFDKITAVLAKARHAAGTL